ncbi:hypothetical protein DYB25_011758 [Aphanomyces astaci]|uniref:Ubiquitin-like protease family profile domain-containing protein n=1 Tax=Aphanomyces astaci TaxID=112090 RepID=A0A397B391_APHAT|nr:hypothetical protein DYB25_011758 [Aphanomyces astaci]RHY12619.1 hypothetical protein DYB36_002402 [Aphanomyces astaci]RHY45160.1 hypothetical protein DYB34_012187 [Aphanomyces astaci]RHY56218.1 hypothetical protein DYB38_002268 [Aphanomyces astaci]RHY61472.1 hypothetical protein DYB30_000735 [Aphanomyces astaci]
MATAVLFHDAQLYDRDLRLFTTNAWLNDAAIHFYFTVVFHTLCGAPADVLLMDPAVVSCMMLQCDDDEDLIDLAQGLQLKEKSLIVLPVNDRRSFDSQGSHWALLVYSTAHGFQFYDSSADHNFDSAMEVAGVLGRALGLPTDSVVRSVPCPQQHNAYDCGMYVCMVAEWLCTSHCSKQSLALAEFVTPTAIQSKRRNMPSIVDQLK